MRTITSIFSIDTAKSHSYVSYKPGPIAFVSNGFWENGVVGYVEPQKGDMIFNLPSICISAFCEATVQTLPFMARGNGGSGLVVLTPTVELTISELIWYASYINSSIQWRFSFGRMVTKDRIENVGIPDSPKQISMTVKSILPTRKTKTVTTSGLILQYVPILKLFEIISGDYHKATDLSDGEIPLISCGHTDNGFVKFCGVPEDKVYENALTVAYNGAPLTTNYHPYKFAAKDDVAVLIPKLALKPTTILFIQMMLNREKWRFSYGRKCFREKLTNMSIKLPVKEEKLDEVSMATYIENTSYWDYIKTRITPNPGKPILPKQPSY